MINPYKEPTNPQILRKVIAAVGEDDWNRIYLPVPFRGQQDVIISSLVYSFAQAVKANNIPTHYEPDNASLLESLLRGASFSPVDRPRRVDDDRRPEEITNRGDTGETSIGTETSEREQETGREDQW